MFLKPGAGRLLAAGAIAGLALVAVPAGANQINVSATIAAACSVGAPATLNFGNYTPTANSQTTTTFTVGCDANSSVGVTLGAGSNLNGARRMKHSTANSFLTYFLFQGPANGGLDWTPNEEKIISNVGTSGTTVTVGGQIPESQTGLPSGSYSDVVLITLDVK